MTLGLNYLDLDTKKEEAKAEKLFKDDAEEKAFQLSDTHVFLPPWADTMLGKYPMAQIYDAYWEIRQRLGHKDLAAPFNKEEFAGLFPPVIKWLQEFEVLANAHPDITPEHIEAFKYLLDECDSFPNSVEGKPAWTWQNLIAIKNPETCKVSEKIQAAASRDARLVEIDTLINVEEPSDSSSIVQSSEPMDEDPGV